MGAQVSSNKSFVNDAVVKPVDNTYKGRKNTFVHKNTRAVIVGINYGKTPYSLSGCVNDADNFLSFIKSRKFGNKTEVLYLNDEGGIVPSKSNLIKAMDWLDSSEPSEAFLTSDTFESKAPSGSSLIIYYAGHGSTVYDVDGDEDDGRDETLCPVTEEGQFDEQIVDDELRDILNLHVRPDVCYIIITDCCHSGTVVDLKYRLIDRKVKTDGKYSDTKGQVYHYGACFDVQTAKEGYVRSERESRGYFTHCFIDSFGSSKLSVGTAYSECTKRMGNFVSKESQLPQCSAGQYPSYSVALPI